METKLFPTYHWPQGLTSSMSEKVFIISHHPLWGGKGGISSFYILTKYFTNVVLIFCCYYY